MKYRIQLLRKIPDTNTRWKYVVQNLEFESDAPPDEIAAAVKESIVLYRKE